jgi:hypothetical protein
MPVKISSEKLVPTDAISELTKGSFEHLSLRLDDAVVENSSLFVGKDEVDVARIATFKDRVIIGTADGRYISAKYEDVDGKIKFGAMEALDVPLVDTSNVSEYVEDYIGRIVESLMVGNKSDGQNRIVALMNLQESVEDNSTDLATLVYDIVSEVPVWKQAYRENVHSIKSALGKIIESIEKSQPEVKYMPLYDGTLPEERFSLYLEPARRDLGAVGERLSTLESKVEKTYLPFIEIAKSAVLEGDEKETMDQFITFAEGLNAEVHSLREHIKIAVENEQCAMCLGQIHDAVASNLSDYEIAGSFVEHMAKLFSSAE